MKLQSVLLDALRDAIGQLRNRPGYGLLRTGDAEFEANTLAQVRDHDDCRRLALLALTDATQQAALLEQVTRVAQNAYSRLLYEQIAADGGAAQRQAYQELGRYLYLLAYNYFRCRHYLPGRARSAAEECSQQALAQVHRYRNSVSDAGRFMGYARKILIHICARVLADDIESPEVNVGDLVRPGQDDEEVSSFLETILAADPIAAVDLHQCCMRALDRLPDKRGRTLLLLEYFEGLKDPEIAAALGVQLANVWQIRRRALMHLRADEELRACL